MAGMLIIANEAISCELRPYQPERAAARFHPAKIYDVMRMSALFRKQLNFLTKHPCCGSRTRVRRTTNARAPYY